MINKPIFGYLGVFATGLIVLDTIQRLLIDNHLRSVRYSGIILFIIAGIFWSIYGVQNKLLPTTFISLFQIIVFVFIFLLKYYNQVNNKHGFRINRARVSKVDRKYKSR